MKQIWQLTTAYTIPEMATFNRIAGKMYPNQKAKITRWVYLLIGLVGIGVGISAMDDASTLWVAFLSGGLGVLYLISFFGHYYIMGYQTQRARPKEVETMSYTFDKMGMVVENATGHSRYSPNEIAKIAEGKKLFIFFTGEFRQGFVIPKRVLEDVDGFRTMIQTLFDCDIEQFKF